MLILGIDLETTCIEPKDGHIIEIGAVLWDVEQKKPVQLYSEFTFPNPSNVESLVIPPEIQELTGITGEDIRNHGILLKYGLEQLLSMMEKAEYLVAHHHSFEQRWLIHHSQNQMGNQMDADFIETAIWIDTQLDVPYPNKIKTRKLEYLAYEHACPNPFSHRAVFDALVMLKILSHYDIEPAIESAQTPVVSVYANVSYNDRHLAKNRGYYWDGDDSRKWRKEMRLIHVQHEIDNAPFRIWNPEIERIKEHERLEDQGDEVGLPSDVADRQGEPF